LSKNLLFRNDNCLKVAFKALRLSVKGFTAFCFLLSFKGNAQVNLVPNPGFETYTTCPNAGGQIDYAVPWIGTSGGVEYFNSCATVYSIPFQNYGSAGFQYARTGNAFAALWMLNGYGNNYREYLEVPLNDTLLNSKCYVVTFYANLQNPINLAVNNFGVYISATLFTTASPFGIPPYTPQILKYKNEIINDTLNWVKVSGLYTAFGGEKYVTIGNFFDDMNTDTIQTGNGTYEGAYYYIDDVSVIPIDSIVGGMPANAGNDTSVIIGDSVFVGQEISNLNCNWYNSGGTQIATNVSGIYVHPIADTYYVVEQNLCGAITRDTVNVMVTGVGITESFLSAEINLYPNPNKGEFILELPERSASWSIVISDLQGRIIYKEVTDNKTVRLKPNAENGVYSVHITNSNTDETVVKKLVLQK